MLFENLENSLVRNYWMIYFNLEYHMIEIIILFTIIDMFQPKMMLCIDLSTCFYVFWKFKILQQSVNKSKEEPVEQFSFAVDRIIRSTIC